MNMTDVKLFLAGSTPPEKFALLIAKEVNEYKMGLEKRGSVAPIVVRGDVEVSLNKESIKLLCEAYLSEQMESWSVHYLADAFLLSDRFKISSPLVRDLIESLADPEISPPLTKERMTMLMKSLNS